MSGAGAEARYDSFLQFYDAVYPQAVTEVRAPGHLGAAMILARQDAGDWSDAPVPDLVVSSTVRCHGPATVDVGGGRFRISHAPPGDFVVIPPGYATTFLVDSPHAIRIFGVPYARLLALAGHEAGLPPDGDFGVLHRGLHRDRETLGLLERLWAEGARGARHGGLWADGLVLQVTARLLHLSGRDGLPRPRGGLAPWQVRRVAEHVEAHLAEDISLAELARLVGLSPNHFCTAFRISLGDPPHRYLARRRMARARELLADSRLSVTNVALAVGFGSSAHFATAFKAHVGSTPTAYRREVLP